MSPLSFTNWGELITKQNFILHRSVKYGLIASLILIYYLVYLIFYNNQTLINFLNFIGILLNELLVIGILLIIPVWNFIKNIKKWYLVYILDKLAEVLLFVVGLFYILPKYFRVALPKLGDQLKINIFLLLFIITLIYYAIRHSKKIRSIVAKPIDNFLNT